MSAEELGLFKEKDVPTYNPEDSSIDYLGNKYQYESVNVDKDGNTQSVNVIDDKGNKKTIRDKFVVEEIEYQKALSELYQSGRLSEITDEDIDNSLKELNIKEYGQEPTQPKAEEVQQAGQGKVAETLTAEKTGQIAPTVVGNPLIDVESTRQAVETNKQQVDSDPVIRDYLENKKQEEITEQTNYEVSLDFIPNKKLAESSNPREFRSRQKEDMRKLDIINKLIKCK